MKMKTQHTQIYDTMNAVLRGKFIVIIALVKKLERSYTIILIVHLNSLE